LEFTSVYDWDGTVLTTTSSYQSPAIKKQFCDSSQSVTLPSVGAFLLTNGGRK
jgi:hypothetical protein